MRLSRSAHLPRCRGAMKIIAFIEQADLVEKILKKCKRVKEQRVKLLFSPDATKPYKVVPAIRVEPAPESTPCVALGVEP